MVSSGSVTVQLEHDIDPVDVGSKSGLLWAHGPRAMAGIGEAMRIPMARPSGAEAALAQLTEFTYADKVQLPGTGTVGFAALPFDPFASGELIVPEIVIGRGPNAEGTLVTWITVFGDIPVNHGLAVVAAIARRAIDQPVEASEFEISSVLAPDFWRDEVLSVAQRQLTARHLDHVSIARELLVRSDAHLDPAIVLGRLRDSFDPAILFSVDGFIGVSDTLLVSRLGVDVRAESVSKEQTGEPSETASWYLDKLMPFCTAVAPDPVFAQGEVLRLDELSEAPAIVDAFCGQIASPAASALELMCALHPSPSSVGSPQKDALQLIAEVERTDRGRFGGPVGWVDAAGNGAFAVGLRSAQLTGTDTRLFASVDVTDTTDAAEGLAETRSRLQELLNILVRP